MSSIAAAGIISALVSVFCAITWLGAQVIHEHQAQSASDLAAIAAAHTHYRGGDACATARKVAELNRATLVDCHVVGMDVVVTSQAGKQTAIAQAGPA